MKKILFVAGMTVIGLSAAFAQDIKQTPAPTATSSSTTQKAIARPSVTKANPENIAKMRTSRLNKELSLSDDQQKKVYDIFLKESQQTQGRSLQRKEIDDQLKAVFTPEQNQKYEALKTERRNMLVKQPGQTRSTLQAAPASEQK